MTFSMNPWRRESETMPERRGEYPFMSLRREMDRLFDDFLTGWGWRTPATGMEQEQTFMPQLDISEVNDHIRIKAELPGMNPEDVNVNLVNDVLTISGEKKKEEEEEGENYYRSECMYGSFHRSIRLPSTIKSEDIDAVFEKGVLTITLPKPEETQTRQQISVRSE
jgi:HSP20 family protein